jgi:hypothetical protein
MFTTKHMSYLAEIPTETSRREQGYDISLSDRRGQTLIRFEWREPGGAVRACMLFDIRGELHAFFGVVALRGTGILGQF